MFCFLFPHKAHGRVRTASHTAAVVLHLLDVRFFFCPGDRSDVSHSAVATFTQTVPVYSHFEFACTRSHVGRNLEWLNNLKMTYKMKEVLAERVGSPFSFFSGQTIPVSHQHVHKRHSQTLRLRRDTQCECFDKKNKNPLLKIKIFFLHRRQASQLELFFLFFSTLIKHLTVQDPFLMESRPTIYLPVPLYHMETCDACQAQCLRKAEHGQVSRWCVI